MIYDLLPVSVLYCWFTDVYDNSTVLFLHRLCSYPHIKVLVDSSLLKSHINVLCKDSAIYPTSTTCQLSLTDLLAECRICKPKWSNSTNKFEPKDQVYRINFLNTNQYFDLPDAHSNAFYPGSYFRDWNTLTFTTKWPWTLYEQKWWPLNDLECTN